MTEQELRAGCCANWPKPCGYHEGYLDGQDASHREWYAAVRSRSMDELVQLSLELGLYSKDSLDRVRNL